MGKHFKGAIILAFVVSFWYRHHPQPSGADVGWLESAKAVLTLLQCHLPSALTRSSQLLSGQIVLVSGWYYPTFNMPQNFILAWHITECLNLFYLAYKVLSLWLHSCWNFWAKNIFRRYTGQLPGVNTCYYKYVNEAIPAQESWVLTKNCSE